MTEITLQKTLIKYSLQNNDISYNSELLTGSRKDLYDLIKTYYLENGYFPNQETIGHIVKRNKLNPEISTTYQEIEFVDSVDKEYMLEKLYDDYLFRQVRKNEDIFLKQIQKVGTKEAYQNFISNLLQTGISDNKVNRGFIWETVSDRWKKYKELESEELQKKKYKYRIKCLDTNLMGWQPASLTCYVASPGVGKTSLALNIGYNLARFEHQHVMFISGELLKSQIEMIFDARDSMIDSMLIKSGNLTDTLRKKYKETLRNQNQRKDNFYVIDTTDIGTSFTSEDIVSWINQYKFQYGIYPQTLIVDYLWLMDTHMKYQSNPEKLGHCAFELRHKIAKPYGIAVHTSTQESREGQLLKKKKKDRGMESIGESNKIAPHAHTIIMLDDFRNSDDLELRNKIELRCVKNTFGPLFTERIWYLREYSYMGDDSLGLVSLPAVSKEKKEKKKEEQNNDSTDLSEVSFDY